MPSVHSIIIRNGHDLRGTPRGSSQLTIDRFELDVPNMPQNSITFTISPAVQSSSVTTAENNSNILQPTQTSGLETTVTPSVVSNVASTLMSSTSTASTSAPSHASSSRSDSQRKQLQTTFHSQPSTTLANSSSVSGSAIPSAYVAPVRGKASKTTRVGDIAGGALGGLAASSILILLIYWLRMKKIVAR